MISEKVITQSYSAQEIEGWKDKDYHTPVEKLVKVGKPQYCLPMSLDVNFIRNEFKIYPDDLWIVTPPKSGTTWTQEIVWLIHTNCDVSKAQCNQFYRIPFLELGHILPEELKGPRPNFKTDEKNESNATSFMAHSFEYVQQLERPRLIKTHLALEVLPKNLLKTCKVIYVARNVKDACVSWYYHQRLRGFKGSFTDMAKLFMEGKQLHCPTLPHIVEAWKLSQDNENLFFTTYEDMKKDLPSVVKEIATFMGKNLSEDQLQIILEQVDFQAFRKNKFVNKEAEVPPSDENQFIRKGIIGDWKNHFTPELNRQWDSWITEQLGDSGYEMVFD